jgi:hypothetical protein
VYDLELDLIPSVLGLARSRQRTYVGTLYVDREHGPSLDLKDRALGRIVENIESYFGYQGPRLFLLYKSRRIQYTSTYYVLRTPYLGKM